jgi:hypothetical protein
LFTLAGKDDAHSRIFANPFMGRACTTRPQDSRVPCFVMESYARATLELAASGEVHVNSDMTPSMQAAVESSAAGAELTWTEDLELNVQHLQIVAALRAHGADVNARTTHLETPLVYAAARGNAAMVDMLCRLGADIEAAT